MKPRYRIVAGMHLPLHPQIVQYRLPDGTLSDYQPTWQSHPDGCKSSLPYKIVVHDREAYRALLRAGGLNILNAPPVVDGRRTS